MEGAQYQAPDGRRTASTASLVGDTADCIRSNVPIGDMQELLDVLLAVAKMLDLVVLNPPPDESIAHDKSLPVVRPLCTRGLYTRRPACDLAACPHNMHSTTCVREPATQQARACSRKSLPSRSPCTLHGECGHLLFLAAIL